MDYGSMLGDSFAYAKDAVIGKWMQWLLLVIATILLLIPLMGYTVRVLRGDRPAPEVNDWGSLIIDGIKYLIISIIYALPALIIMFATMGTVLVALASGNTAEIIAGLGGMVLGIILFLIVAIICGLFGTIGLIRFARTGSIGEAFNFAEIKETIGKIGWVSYIIALVIMGVIQVIISVFFSALVSVFMPLGLLVELLFLAPVVIFEARYLALIYDSVGTA
jgi:hypothetical protein